MKVILILFIVLYVFHLYPQNYMELMTELTGEHPNSEFGFHVESLDFNGDSIDDLVIGAYKWDPEYPGYPAQSRPWGRIYFYFGSEVGFGESVDLIIASCDTLIRIGAHLQNLGDMNADSLDELGYRSFYYDLDENVGYSRAHILLGNNDNNISPSFTYVFTSEEYDLEHPPLLKWLGDINGDGYDDAGVIMSEYSTQGIESANVYLIYGNHFELVHLCTFESTYTNIQGIGDINIDGYYDFVIGTSQDDTYQNLLYLGNTTFIDSLPDFILNECLPNSNLYFPGGYPIGDWNGDGLDDFIGNYNSDGIGIWYGSESLEMFPSMHLSWGGFLDFNNDFGDLNNDGFSDFVIGNHVNSGYSKFYLGNQNGTCDLQIDGENDVNAGWAIAIGDFNNDGFDDTAIGGPGLGTTSGVNDCWCGKVYVYAGNPDLEEADPNILNEEKIIILSECNFSVYPNPFNPTTTISFYLNEAADISLDLYNVRGQLINTIVKGRFNRGQNGILFNDEELNSGIYFINLIINNKRMLSEKVIFLK
jgi:hypothetical protein